KPEYGIVIDDDAVERTDVYPDRGWKGDHRKTAGIAMPFYEAIAGIAGHPEIALRILGDGKGISQVVALFAIARIVVEAVSCAIETAEAVAFSQAHPYEAMAVPELGCNGDLVECWRLTWKGRQPPVGTGGEAIPEHTYLCAYP